MKHKLVATFAERLKQALEQNTALTATALAEEIGLSKQAISMYLSGDRTPKPPTLRVLAHVLNVSEEWLCGYDGPMRQGLHPPLSAYDNVFPISVRRLPLLGEIACGEPVFAQEDRESYILAGSDVPADFCLRAKGDSMINARILDGDVVFVKRQDIVENGEIAAVGIADEATLKRVYYYPDKSLLILKAENPKYEDLIYTKEQLDEVRILGKAVAFQSDVF